MPQTAGRVKRIFAGLVVGALLVLGWQVFNGIKTYDSGANLGKVDKAERTISEPRFAAYPGAKGAGDNDTPRTVVFVVQQAGFTSRLNVTTVAGLNPKRDLLKRVATYKRTATVERGQKVSMSAEIVKNDRSNAAGPIACTIVINGLVYRTHGTEGQFRPFGPGQYNCNASAVVP